MPDANATNPPGDILKNTVLAREKFRDELHKLHKEIEEAKAKPGYELAADVAKTEKINRDQAVQRFTTWKAENDRLITQRTAVDHFVKIYEEVIAHAEANLIVPILTELIDSLRQTLSQEQGEAEALNKRIADLELERNKKRPHLTEKAKEK